MMVNPAPHTKFRTLPIAEAQEREEDRARRSGRPVARERAGRAARAFPAHLPRVERVIESASLTCPCGRGLMVQIGEDRSSRLDVTAYSDEAGHAFQYEAGHPFRSEAGRGSDLMSATGCLVAQIDLDDVSCLRRGQARSSLAGAARRLRKLSPESSIR